MKRSERSNGLDTAPYKKYLFLNYLFRQQRAMIKEQTWKCFVRPGVADTGTFFVCRIALMVELFPTFG